MSIDLFISAMRDAGCGPYKESEIAPGTESKLIRDEHGKKTIYYTLNDDCTFGRWYSCKTGDHDFWHIKTDKGVSAEEKADLKAKRDLARQKAEDDTKQIQNDVAALAKLEWDRAVPAHEDHPYAVSKWISVDGLRQKDDALLIPMYADQRLFNLQSILPDGEKFNSFRGENKEWIKGGRKKGCYSPLAHADDDKTRMVFCEGYATGRSIREATRLPVIICFDAANLVAVIKDFRKKYPDTQFIVAADNDRFTTKPVENPGIFYANQAAAAAGGAYVIYPEFPEDDKGTDFNDLHHSVGLEAVKERILAIPEPPKPESERPDIPIDEYEKQVGPQPYIKNLPDVPWQEKALWKYDKSGEAKSLDPDKSFNYSLLMEEHPALKGIFAWDEFHICPMMVAMAPWSDGKRFEVHRLEDQDIREADYFLQKTGMNGSLEKTRGAIYGAAFKNPIHPARDYFNSLVWDQKPRLDKWLITYCGATKDDADYVRAIGRTFLTAAVKRVYDPGCKYDHMLILEGKQGIYKSSALKELATFGDGDDKRSYFTDTFRIKNASDKDELMKLHGKLIIEIAELSGFNKSDRDELTSFITTTDDTYRTPYGMEMKTYPRQFVLAGTYNPVNGIFTDPTGFRRFWPVEVTKIDIERLKLDKGQLWAEAVHRYKSGDSLVLSPELYKKAEEAGAARRVVDDWTQDVLHSVKGRAFFEVRDIMRDMGMDVKSRSQSESRRIGGILKAEGFERVRKRVGGGSPVWGWEPPKTQGELLEEENLPF